jgi:hypothetical protein
VQDYVSVALHVKQLVWHCSQVSFCLTSNDKAVLVATEIIVGHSLTHLRSSLFKYSSTGQVVQESNFVEHVMQLFEQDKHLPSLKTDTSSGHVSKHLFAKNKY